MSIFSLNSTDTFSLMTSIKMGNRKARAYLVLDVFPFLWVGIYEDVSVKIAVSMLNLE